MTPTQDEPMTRSERERAERRRNRAEYRAGQYARLSYEGGPAAIESAPWSCTIPSTAEHERYGPIWVRGWLDAAHRPAAELLRVWDEHAGEVTA